MSIKNERPSKGKGGRVSPHSESFRVQLALEYIQGSYSYPQVARKYGLPEHTIISFVSWYRKTQNQLMPEEPLIPNEPLSSEDRKGLEKRLVLAEMKIAALEKVIAIANQEYNTDLKKKAATK